MCKEKLKKYTGILETYQFCEAISEEDAQNKLRDKLIQALKEDPEPFIVWEDND